MNRLLRFKQVESRPPEVQLKKRVDPFNAGGSCIPKINLLVDPGRNKLLFIRQKPRLLNITNLLEVRQGILLLELYQTFLVCLLSRRVKNQKPKRIKLSLFLGGLEHRLAPHEDYLIYMPNVEKSRR